MIRLTSLLLTTAMTLQAADATIAIDANDVRQSIEGFGATSINWADGGSGDSIEPQRQKVIQAIYGQVKLSMGDIHCGPYEGSAIDPSMPIIWSNLDKSNDNNDPNTFDWSRFHWWRSDPSKSVLYDLAAPYGFTNVMLSGRVSTRWGDQWLNTIRSTNRPLYLAEAAENAVAILVHWRNAYGIVPEWHQLFNEPLSGNNEVYGGNTQELVDLVKAAGARFKAEGFGAVKFVIASEETTAKSIDSALAILQDPVARQYVGAISYHSYPYGSTYCKASSIIATSGAGMPDSTAVNDRITLKNIASQYGVQCWMTEVSHSEAGSWMTCRARSIHIHDELLYAGANSYWAMFNMYDLSQPDEEDMVVLFDTATQTYRITGMGYAIGHYARWLTPKKSFLLGSSSSDPLVQTSVFKDTQMNRVVSVLINNSALNKTVDVTLSGLAINGNVTGERSTESGGYWQPLAPFASSPNGFTLTLPPHSITSTAVAMGSITNAAPSVSAGPDRTITLPATASLDGTVSDDGLPSGSALTMTWSVVSGPGSVSFSPAAAADTIVSFSAAGTYLLRLTASDSALSANDTVSVIVMPVVLSNAAPAVSAGPDRTITLPATASLDGTVTDDGLPSGSALTMTWSVVSGPGSVSFSPAAAADTIVSFSAAGTYLLRLTASDSALSANDTVSVVVSSGSGGGGTAVVPGKKSSSSSCGLGGMVSMLITLLVLTQGLTSMQPLGAKTSPSMRQKASRSHSHR